jgi:CHAD domain-containing protein
MAKLRGINLTDGSASPGKGATVAVAAAGTAAAAGKLAWDKLHAGQSEDFIREYGLHAGEFVPDGIRRIARGQLDSAVEELEGASDRKLGEAVHETRKRLKRLRTCLRVIRPVLGEDVYEHENAAFREAGRRLAAARDARVLAETLDKLGDRFRDELQPVATGDLRARVEDEHETAIGSLRGDGQTIGAVLAELRSARQRTAGWTLVAHDVDALAPGLRRVYARGRRRMRTAAAEPSTENLHEWRKRVKDLWYASQIVRPAGPKRMKRLARRAHHLSDLLGDDHDLAVLRAYVEGHPECFEDEASRGAVVAVIDRRREALQHEALELGGELYKRSPKKFVRSIERRWRKRAPEQAQPASA